MFSGDPNVGADSPDWTDVDTRDFWTEYQPGFRFAPSPVGSRTFFEEVTAYRDAVEPHVPGVVQFERWSGKDVLEAGCGIGTDGVRFAAAGARYTGLDFSRSALPLARRRFDFDAVPGRFATGSVTELPFAAESFDLVFSHGVIHHIPGTEVALKEFHRVLRPGGTVLVMVYHRRSFNYFVTIMGIRRVLVGLLMFPRSSAPIAKITREPEEVLRGHRQLLSTHGVRYVLDTELFLSRNTDGPANPLSKVYSRRDLEALLPSGFHDVSTEVRYLNLRTYPGGNRAARTATAARLERRLGWHLYLRATKSGQPATTRR